MELPTSTATYGDVAYWNSRFEEETDFEWCGRYDEFSAIALAALSSARRILILGNGTSALPLALAADAGLAELQEVVVTDAASVAVDRGRSRATADAAAVTAAAAACGRTTPPATLTWSVADAAAIPFPDASFDAVVEKGVLDALAARHAGADPWAPPPGLVTDVGGAAAEVARVTRRGGVLLSVSFAQPHFRRPLLLASGANVWSDVTVTPFGEDKGAIQYFAYVCVRGGGVAAPP